MGFARTGNSIPSFFARSKISVDVVSPEMSMILQLGILLRIYCRCNPVSARQVDIQQHDIDSYSRYHVESVFCSIRGYGRIAGLLKQHGEGFCNALAIIHYQDCCLAFHDDPLQLYRSSGRLH